MLASEDLGTKAIHAVARQDVPVTFATDARRGVAHPIQGLQAAAD